MASWLVTFVTITLWVIGNNHNRVNLHQVEIAEIKKDHESDLEFLSYRLNQVEQKLNNQKVTKNDDTNRAITSSANDGLHESQNERKD